MYNRYVRNDNGAYRRRPTQQAQAPPRAEAKNDYDHPHSSGGNHSAPPPGGSSGMEGLLSGILGRLKPNEMDSGDLLLLVLLFLLFRDGEDDELLIALGLLLIL